MLIELNIMKINNHKCLVLNSDYSPLTIVNWQKAMVWVFREYNHNSVDILDYYKDDFIIGASRNYPIPAVAKINFFYKKFNKQVKFTRKNLFLRDDYTCQYCNVQMEKRYLTYDHIIPKAQWGKYPKEKTGTTWTNVVTACKKCNNKKGSKTPKQANMPLNKAPVEPSNSEKYLPVIDRIVTISNIPEEWILYLPTRYLELCQFTHTSVKNANGR